MDNNKICTTCNGSGEGMHDATRCQSCKGYGVIKNKISIEINSDIYTENQADAMRDDREFY